MNSQELEVRRKRHKTEGSSIQSRQSFFGPLCKIAVVFLTVSIFGAQASELESRAANQDRQIEEVADQFEGVMLQLLYNQMVQSQKLVQMGDDNPFAPSNAELIYRSMQEEGMLQQLAKRRPLGVGSLVARQLKGQTGVSVRPLVQSDARQQKTAAKAD